MPVKIRFQPGLKPIIQKHQQHDQQSHGNWASGGEMSDVEFKDVVYGSKTIEQAYQKIAKRLGKNMKVREAELSDNEVNVYRGVTNVERDTQNLVNGKIRFTPFQTWGQGIYVEPSRERATEYGTVLSLRLDPKAKILRGEEKWSKGIPVKFTDTGVKSDNIDFDKINMDNRNFSVSDVNNLYWASKGYDGFSPHGGEMVLFNGGVLTLDKNRLQKHQQHDQQSHGNWAGGSSAKDISGELGDYFGKTLEEYSKSKAREEISKRSEEGRQNHNRFENYALEIIAEKQGFAGKPKVLSEKEMKDLESKGWVTTYRGIQDYSEDSVSVTKDAKTLAQEFRDGSYYAGFGASGDGIYTTTDFDVAKGYAGEKGVVLKIAVPPKSFMSPAEFNDAIDTHRARIRSGKANFWLDDDLGVDLASKGNRAALHYRNIGYGGITIESPVFVIWDRSMLAVQDTNL